MTDGASPSAIDRCPCPGPTYLQEHYHLRQGAAGFSATGYLNLDELGGILVSGLWADRWTATQPRARILVLAIGYCCAAPGVFLVAHAGVLATAIGGLILLGIASGFVDSNLVPTQCLVTAPRYCATAYGLGNMGATVAGGLAIYGVGVLRDRGMDFGRMLGLASFALLLCPLLLFWIRPVRFIPNSSASSGTGDPCSENV